MEAPAPDARLVEIPTHWSLIYRAHQTDPREVTQARHQLLSRYAPAVRRYLGGTVSNPDLVDELFQEFCLRLLRGDFHRARPERGRFRDLVKTTLINLVMDHHRGNRARPRPLPADVLDSGHPSLELPEAEEFLERWREELLRHAWEELAAFEQQTGQPYHTVLRFRVDFPLLSSVELAGELAVRLGRPLSSDAVRQLLRRSRDRYADLLLEEVVRSLGSPACSLEEELIDLDLFGYCRAALTRCGRAAA